MEQYAITKEQCKEIAEEMICSYLTAKAGQRLVSDYEDPAKAYIQEQNTYSQAGEIFNVNCPGIGDGDWSYLRVGWDCDDLSDEEVIEECCEKGDMSNDINKLANNIWNSVVETKSAEIQMSQEYAIYRMKTDDTAEPVFADTEKEVRTKWKQYTGRPALLDFFIADEKNKNFEIRMKKIARETIEESCKEELEEEPEKEELCTDNGKIYYYYPNRFVIRHKATGGLRYIADGSNDIIHEWNEYYADRPYASDYFVEIDHKSIDYSYHHKLPKNKNLEVTVTKDGYIKFLDGSYV